QRAPGHVRRVVVMNAVPLLPGYHWHRVARVWRTPLAGELLMGFTTRFAMRRSMPRALADRVWEHFDHGTQRAILRLYRSAPPNVLAAAGERLGEIRAPALVLWSENEPYLPTEFADRYAQALGGETTVEVMSGAGHWLWLDRPDAIEKVTSFLGAGA